MKKASSMPIEIKIAVVMLVVVALVVIMFTTGKIAQPPMNNTAPLSAFQIQCTAFCESKNFTYLDINGMGNCLCIEPRYNTAYTYVYDTPKNVFYKWKQ